MRRRFLWFCCKHRSLKDTSGHFLKKITNTTTSTSVPLSTFVTMDSGHAAGVYNCPQSGCIRVFQRVSTSETDLSLENRVLINFTKMCYIRVRVALLLRFPNGVCARSWSAIERSELEPWLGTLLCSK